MSGAPQHVQDSGFALKTIIDTSVANTKYICEAAPGSASSSPVWRVQRIVTNGALQTISYAGTGAFDQIADNRLTLSY